jgi:FAD/FMN-containing dehydrogenase
VPAAFQLLITARADDGNGVVLSQQSDRTDMTERRLDRVRAPVGLPGIAGLEAEVEGSVVPRDSPDFEALRKPAWAQFEDIAPEAVVLCMTAADVAETIKFARRVGAAIAARSGAHCFAGRSSTRGILIDLSEMRSISVADGLATVEAGALLGDVYDGLDSHDLTIAAGACPWVGIAGLTLGGGFGILGRRYGLTSDQLIGARVVLADGRVVDCNEHREPDLFWALRGAGGGQLGIVTTFLFRTVPAQDLTCFKLGWPYAQAAAAIELWQDWAPDAPDELAASLLVTATGDLDEPAVTIFGAMLGTETETADTLDHLLARLDANPASTTIKQMPHRVAKTFLAEHAPGAERAHSTMPPPPRVMFAKSEFFRRPLPPNAIAALVDAFAERRGTGHARELDFTPWSGAYNRTRTDATAFAHRNERFLLKHAVVLDADAEAQERDAARDWLARSWSIVHPHGSGRVYPSFPDPDLTDWARAYHDVNYERLTHVKARYDRDNLFRFHQSLPPEYAGPRLLTER